MTIALWTIGLSYLTFRSRKVGSVMDSTPAIVVTDGVVDDAMLAVHRLRHDDLLDEARNSGIVTLSAIKYAVLEADGKFSFIARDCADRPEQNDDEPEV